MRVPFDPPPGIVSNETVYAAPGAWTDGNNMRLVDSRPQTIGGWEKVFDINVTGVCRTVIGWTDLDSVTNIAFGTSDTLEIYSGGEHANITPADLSPGAVQSSGEGPGYGTGTYGMGVYSIPASGYIFRVWSLDTWGETLLGVPRGGTLYQWSNSLTDLAEAVTSAPGNITAMLVTPERQVLALGCNEEVSNDFNGLCIRGSDIEDLADWTTSADNNAFEHILTGGGQILTGAMVGSYVGVWTDNSLHMGQFIGSPGQAYRFDRVDDNCGTIGPKAVTVLKGVAFWVGADRQFRAWTPGSKVSILPCPVWKEFSDNIHESQAATTIAVSNSRFDEVWFYYPDARDGNECNRYIAFNCRTMEWFKGDFGRTAATDAGVLPNPIGVTSDGTVYHHELGTRADGVPLNWSLRSAPQYVSEAEKALQIQEVQPDFKGQENDIFLSIDARMHPQGSVRTYGPYTLAPGATRKHFRLTGKILELAFSGVGYVRFGKPTFDAIGTGRR